MCNAQLDTDLARERRALLLAEAERLRTARALKPTRVRRRLSLHIPPFPVRVPETPTLSLR